MSWIYFSPHFDDVALSCGGLVWEQTHAGEKVNIWTVCAGGPPPGDLSPFAQELHSRWKMSQNAPAQRMAEDITSCHRLGAGYQHFSIPDCIYRRNPQTDELMYPSEAALNGPLHPGDAEVVDDLLKDFRALLPADVILICPLALGNHVDHQLTRMAAQGLGRKCWYYADFPYVLRFKEQLDRLQSEGWETRIFRISQRGLSRWQESISAYRSQISTFWPSEHAMRQAVSDYLQGDGGVSLWSKPAA